MNYSKFITKISAARMASPIRELNRAFPSEMILLTAGKPNPDLFPFSKATFETHDGCRFALEGEKMKEALQYTASQGIPELVQWVKELQDREHKPPFKDTDVVLTCGSQDGLCKAFEMSLNVGDPIIVEEFVYPGTLAALNPYSPKYISVKSDAQGMDPDSLEQKLKSLSEDTCLPKLLYLNPTGANPTGTVIPVDRRRRIYDMACEHDLLILEDDPYYYLQFNKERVPSFYSMDVEGRVVRFDSFSKILSSGLRLGFVTGPKPLIQRILLHMQVSVMHASSLSQYIAQELLSRWGLEGFFNHVDKVQAFYRGRRDDMHAAAKKHLSGLCEWSVPGGGMFLWLNVPGVKDTWEMIMTKAQARNVLLIPGSAFVPGGGDSSFMRASYSVADVADFDPAFARLAEVIRDSTTS